MRLLCCLCLLLAGWAHAAHALDYRGRTISVGPSPDAEACIDLVRKGIDLVEQLPAPIRKLGAMVTDLRCNPVAAKAEKTSVYDNTTGVYVMESEDQPKGFIVFRRSPGFQSPQDIALSLVGNGVYAKRHRDWIEARSKAKSGDRAAEQRYARLTSIVTRSDLKAVVMAECENLDATYQTLKALDSDPKRLSALSNMAFRRGCPI